MSTVIFKWNPSFSSYTMKRFLNDMEDVNDSYSDFNWSVWDYEKIHTGDECFWLKVGYGQTGIVGHGVITSEPYEDEDWSGKGRKTFYVDFKPDIMLCADAFTLLDSDALQRVIPDFDWHGGHSGLVLSEGQAIALSGLWKDYLAANKEAFEKAKSDNVVMKEYFEAVMYDDGDKKISLFLSDRRLLITQKDNTEEINLSSWNVGEIKTAYALDSVDALGEKFKQRYGHPGAISAIMQDFLTLNIGFNTGFNGDDD